MDVWSNNKEKVKLSFYKNWNTADDIFLPIFVDPFQSESSHGCLQRIRYLYIYML